MYDTVEEARQKLAQSVVLFDQEPVYIVEAGGNKNKVQLQYVRLPLNPRANSPETQWIPINDPRWDFKTLGSRLGYVAVKHQLGFLETVFTSRIPTRHSRQGLDGRTVYVKQGEINQQGYDWSQVTCSEGLIQTMKGEFPSFKEAFLLITKSPDKFKSIPFNRKMMLQWDQVTPPVLLYRSDKVGYTENGTDFKLAKHKEFLREELVDQIGLKIA